MKQLELEEIKAVENNLLQHFDKFCKKQNITYYLSNGTLLGAIKYGGFIPWDDDIDVFVPRKDYDRLMAEYTDNNIKLYSSQRCKNYFFPFAKLADDSTLKIEEGTNNGEDIGINIDIFPLDIWGNTMEEALLKLKKIKRAKFMLTMAKVNKITSDNIIKSIIKIICVAFARAFGAKHYVNKITKIAKSGKQNGNFVGCVVWPIYKQKEIIPSQVFNGTVSVNFEKHHYPAPTGYDCYLRSLYNDYAKDPPLDKQCTHHRFKAYIK